MTPKWRNRKTWNSAGGILTVAWIAYVVTKTGGDPAHPLSNLVFIVPIALWVAIIVITRIFRIDKDGQGSRG